MKRNTVLIITCILTLYVIALALPANAQKEKEVKTDYSNNNNWSIKCEDIKHDVDVFFVHPTTYYPPANGKYNADLNDKKLNEETDSGIDRLTGVFTESCNVFAPRYRQVNLEVMQMPEEIGNLTNIDYINGYDNKLNTLPLTLLNLPNIETLFLAYNELTFLPIFEFRLKYYYVIANAVFNK